MMRFGIIALLIVTSIGCANKKITEKTPQAPTLNSQGGSFQKIVPGMEDGDHVVKLVIPISSSLDGISVDSVYFMGFKVAMRGAGSPEDLAYKAKLNISTAKPHTPPQKLGNNEALVVWRHEGKRRLFKVSDLEEKEALYAP